MLLFSSCALLDRCTWGGRSRLSELYLGDNAFGPQVILWPILDVANLLVLQGAQSIGRMLQRTTCVLQVLDLNDNMLGDEGEFLALFSFGKLYMLSCCNQTLR